MQWIESRNEWKFSECLIRQIFIILTIVSTIGRLIHWYFGQNPSWPLSLFFHFFAFFVEQIVWYWKFEDVYDLISGSISIWEKNISIWEKYFDSEKVFRFGKEGWRTQRECNPITSGRGSLWSSLSSPFRVLNTIDDPYNWTEVVQEGGMVRTELLILLPSVSSRAPSLLSL